MEDVLFYSGKVMFTSGVLFSYYQLFLKDKTFHHYNRFYLLGAMLVSLFLPLLQVNYFTIEVNNDIYLLIDKLEQTNFRSDPDARNYLVVFLLGSGLISVCLVARFFFGVFKILSFKNRFPKEESEGINFYHTDLNNAPFSYFRNVFWKNSIPLHSDLGKQILKHEMVHIEQKHTYDKIFIEIIKSAFWFNPFFYFIKNEIHLIHEYLADKNAIRQSDTKAFAHMLLASHFPGSSLPVASPLLSANLKKRLRMLKAPRTKFSYARRALALPVLLVLFFAYVVNAKNKEIKADHIEMVKYLNTIQKDAIIKQPDIITEKNETGSEMSEEAGHAIKTLEQSDMGIRERPEEQILPIAKSIECVKSDEWKARREVMEQVNNEAGKAKEKAEIARKRAGLAKKHAGYVKPPGLV